MTVFTCLCRNGYLGISFLIYAGSFLLDSGMSAGCFLHSLLGVRESTACCQSRFLSSGRHTFHDLDAWGVVALPLFSVFDRGSDFETIS